MPSYEVSSTIGAPIDVVWSVLVDVERMPEWTSSMQSVTSWTRVGAGPRDRADQAAVAGREHLDGRPL